MQNAILSLLTTPDASSSARGDPVSTSEVGEDFALLVQAGETMPEPTGVNLEIEFPTLLPSEQLANLVEMDAPTIDGAAFILPEGVTPSAITKAFPQLILDENLAQIPSIPLDVEAEEVLEVTPLKVKARKVSEGGDLGLQAENTPIIKTGNAPTTRTDGAIGATLPTTFPGQPSTEAVAQTQTQTQISPSQIAMSGSSGTLQDASIRPVQQENTTARLPAETPLAWVENQSGQNAKTRLTQTGSVPQMNADLPDLKDTNPSQVRIQAQAVSANSQGAQPFGLPTSERPNTYEIPHPVSAKNPDTPTAAPQDVTGSKVDIAPGANAETQVASQVQTVQGTAQSAVLDKRASVREVQVSADGTPVVNASMVESADKTQKTAPETPAQLTPEISGAVPSNLTGKGQDTGLAPLSVAQSLNLDAGPLGTLSAKPEPALARHIAAQIVDIAQPLPNRPVEMTLSPEELGKVRLTFVTDNGAMAVSVAAERPETLELMRRHIETLAQELRNIGYRDVSFGFGQSGGNASSDTPNGFGDTQADASSEAVAEQAQDTHIPSTQSANPDLAAGIDIRL